MFELASGRAFRPSLRPSPRDEGAPRFTEALRVADAVRCVGGQYPNDRWTAEKEEKERQRRARQKPPRPPKGARSKRRKLRDLVGADYFDD